MAAVVLLLSSQGNHLRYSMAYGLVDSAAAIALDAQDDVYTAVADSPVVGRIPHVLILKLDRNGPNGPGTKMGRLGFHNVGYPNGIAVMGNGNVVVAGATDKGFAAYKGAQPTYGGGDSDGFVAELDPSLKEVLFSTFLGGSGLDTINALVVDNSNNIYVTGDTQASDFPHTTLIDELNAESPFVTKLSSNGKIVYSSIIGVPVIASPDAIVVNKQGYATIGGSIYGNGMTMIDPLKGQDSFRGGAEDGFVATLGGAGQRVLFSSYLGGRSDEKVTGLAIGGSGNLFATGVTASANFPRTLGRPFNSPAFDGFLVKISNH